MSSILVATASYDRHIKLWRVHPVEQTRSFNFSTESHVNCLSVSPDRTRLAAAGYTSIKVYDLTALMGDGGSAANAQQQTVVSQSQDNGHTANVTAIGFVRSVQGAHMLFSTSEDGTWKLWDTRAPGLRLKRVVDVKEPLNCGVLLHNSMIVAGSQLGTIGVWSLNSSSDQKNPDGLIDSVTVQSEDPAVRSVALSPGGDVLVAATNSGHIYVLGIGKGIGPNAGKTEGGDKSAEGEAAAERDGEREESQPAVARNASELPNVSVLTAGTDPKQQGTTPHVRGGQGHLVLLWSFEAHSRYVLKCCISPNGAMLCTTSADCTVNLWRMPESLPKLAEQCNSGAAPPEARSDKWELVRSITSHQRWVWDCAFSRCSLYVVTASSDHTGRLWHIESGKLEANFSGHQKPVTCIVLDDRRES
jgi:G protein beta subunit-like protein